MPGTGGRRRMASADRTRGAAEAHRRPELRRSSSASPPNTPARLTAKREQARVFIAEPSPRKSRLRFRNPSRPHRLPCPKSVPPAPAPAPEIRPFFTLFRSEKCPLVTAPRKKFSRSSETLYTSGFRALPKTPRFLAFLLLSWYTVLNGIFCPLRAKFSPLKGREIQM